MGRLIAKQRIKKELTQEQLAEKLRVDRTTVSKWERAISSPDISLLQLLAKELDLTIPELLNGEKNIQNEDIDSATINAIEFYNEKAKTKYRKWAIFLISLLTCFFLSLFIVNNYNKYEVYKINATGDDFLVTGYFIANHK